MTTPSKDVPLFDRPEQWAAHVGLYAVMPQLAELEGPVGQRTTPPRWLEFHAPRMFAATRLGAPLPTNDPAMEERLPRLVFRFGTARRLASAFQGRTVVPVPTRGCWRVGSLIRVLRLSKRLEHLLRPSPTSKLSSAELRQHATMLLEIALLGGETLAENGEPWICQRLAQGPTGSVRFAIEPSTQRGARVTLTANRLEVILNTERAHTDATVTFMRPEIASRALRGQLDEVAAVGRGDIRIEGNAALADHLGYLLRRVDYYLEGRYNE
ncbi:MAG: hypothetical protein ACFB20_02260 [Opitutales bacterium]